MPADVLATALLPVSAVPGGTVTDTSVEGVTEGAGYSIGFEFVSGDEACRQLLDAHPVTVATGAGQEIDSADLGLSQLVESFPTVADAQAVMLQNDSQVKSCRQATVAYDGKQYPATHELLVADGEGDQMTALVHVLDVEVGSNSILAVVMNEHRNGGEIMFLTCYPLSSKGIATMNALMPQATAQFESVVDAYRVDHPRP